MSTQFWQETEVQLMPGETILYRGQPDRTKLRRLNLLISISVACVFFPLLFLFPVYLWTSRRSAERHQFYVTNGRIIVTDGLIGYQTRSVPFERVSDVGASCSILERWVGVRKLTIRDMTGEAHGGVHMKGLVDTRELKELILSQVQAVNSKQRRSAEDTTTSSSSNGVNAHDKMIELLEKIEGHLASNG